MTLWVLDTNVISDRIDLREPVTRHLNNALLQSEPLVLCQPVYYEVERGLIKKGATAKLQFFEAYLVPTLEWVELTNDDWRLASQLWVLATKQGRQLSDIDLLVAAVAVRLMGVMVSDDNDFDILRLDRVNWRRP